MSIDTSRHPYYFTSQFIDVLNQIHRGGGTTYNFRDPSYSSKSGGYHPVEIAISTSGQIEYVTDFAYMGEELVKELDWDFTLGIFQQYGQEYELEDGRALFYLYQSNFIAYFHMGVYQLDLTKL